MAITINIKSTNMDLYSSVEEYVNSKVGAVEKYLDLSGDRVAFADVEVGKTSKHHNKGDVFRAEINLKYDGKNFRVVSKKHDMKVAIDDCCNDLCKRVRKNKSRKMDLVRKGGSKIKSILRGFRK